MFKTKVYLERGDKEHEIEAELEQVYRDQFDVNFNTLLDLTSEEEEGLRYDAIQNFFMQSVTDEDDAYGDYLYEQSKERDLG